MSSLKAIQDILKHSNIHIIGIPGRAEKKVGRKDFEELNSYKPQNSINLIYRYMNLIKLQVE